MSFQPASLDVDKLHHALYATEGIVCATRHGSDRGGLRLSPHIYNLHVEVDRTIAAVKKYHLSRSVIHKAGSKGFWLVPTGFWLVPTGSKGFQRVLGSKTGASPGRLLT